METQDQATVTYSHSTGISKHSGRQTQELRDQTEN